MLHMIGKCRRVISGPEKILSFPVRENRLRPIRKPEPRRKAEKAGKAGKQAMKTYNTVAMGNINFIWLCPQLSRSVSDAGAFAGRGILPPFPGTAAKPTYSYSAGIYHDSS